MERESAHTTVVVAGAEVACDHWATAFRGVEGVQIERLRGSGEDDLLASLARPGIDAAVFVSPMPELAAAVKRSLMAGRHVFVAGDVALASIQLTSIDELARRRSRAIVFEAAGIDAHLAFVRRMTSGAAAIWRPMYIRALRTQPSNGQTIDELAIAECARVLSLMDDLPRSVHAFAPRIDDESGRCDAAMLMLSFDGGAVAQVDVSMVEPSPRREMLIACEGRTIVLDSFDYAAPIRIDAAARHRGPRRDGEWGETISEHPLTEAVDGARTVEAREFIATVRNGSLINASNARQLANAARVWEAARVSMSRGGDRIDVCDAEPDRPRFRVIEGGGHGDGPHHAPPLKLISRS